MPEWLLPPRPKHPRPTRGERIRRVALRAVPAGGLTVALLCGMTRGLPNPAGRATAATAVRSSSTGRVPGECVRNPKGIPRSGAYVGAAVGGTQRLPQLERRAGHLGVHRSYYHADEVRSAIRTSRTDIATHRLPWISIKMPYSWAAMANGRGDGWVRKLADKLARLPGPVWLAFHHEPENDGNVQEWKRMQQHLAPIIHARTNNVAYTIILTTWDALFGPAQFHLSRVWPGSRYVDVLGMDMYNLYGSNLSRHSNLPMLKPMKYFRPISRFAQAHHVPWGIAETGYSAAAARREPNWLVTEYRDLRAEGGLALTYFDSSLDSTNWTLSDPRKMQAFRTVLRSSQRVCPDHRSRWPTRW